MIQAGLVGCDYARPAPTTRRTARPRAPVKGRDLAPVTVALTAWGDRHAAPSRPPITHEYTACRREIHQQIYCAACEAEISSTDIRARPGPGCR